MCWWHLCRAFNGRILYGLYLPTFILTVIWYSITHSLFLSRLKTSLLCKSFPLQPFLSYLQDTWIFAGWPLRNSVTASRSSRHQSKNRPHFFARSRLVLKPLTVFAITESLPSIFHLDTTRWEKKYFLISLLHRHLTSFNECPRVHPVVSIWNIVNGIAEKPWAILKTFIKSALLCITFPVKS